MQTAEDARHQSQPTQTCFMIWNYHSLELSEAKKFFFLRKNDWKSVKKKNPEVFIMFWS